MAAGGNTWCKKLMAKDKKWKMAQRLGSSQRRAANGLKDLGDAVALPMGRSFERKPRTFGSKPSALAQ